jgi:hypothetical protein
VKTWRPPEKWPQASHEPIQRRDFQRFHKLVGETFLPTAPLVGRTGETTQGIDSCLLKAPAGTQLMANGIAIQSRHFNIEENDIRVTLAGDTQRCLAVAAGVHFVTSELQQFAQ